MASFRWTMNRKLLHYRKRTKFFYSPSSSFYIFDTSYSEGYMESNGIKSMATTSRVYTSRVLLASLKGSFSNPLLFRASSLYSIGTVTYSNSLHFQTILYKNYCKSIYKVKRALYRREKWTVFIENFEIFYELGAFANAFSTNK